MPRRWHLTYRLQLYLLLVPFLGGVLLLIGIPTLVTFGLSLTRYDVFSPPVWNGLANFENFTHDQFFQRALFNSIWFIIIAVPLRLAGALLLALGLNRDGRIFHVARVTVYLPTLMPEVAYALMWLMVLNPGAGPLNLALGTLHLPTPDWLQQPFTARASLILMWSLQVGEGFVLLLAARQFIPDELFESAALDGASPWQRFRHLLLPLLAPVLVLLALRDIALSFQGVFVTAMLTTQTGPYYATYFLGHYVYDESFGLFKYGYGSAVTMVIYALSLAAMSALLWLTWQWVAPDET